MRKRARGKNRPLPPFDTPAQPSVSLCPITWEVPSAVILPIFCFGLVDDAFLIPSDLFSSLILSSCTLASAS